MIAVLVRPPADVMEAAESLSRWFSCDVFVWWGGDTWQVSETEPACPCWSFLQEVAA